MHYVRAINVYGCLFAVRENERRQAEAAREREELLVKISENRRLEEEEQARVKAQAMQYQNDLIGQIHYNRRNQDIVKVSLVRISQNLRIESSAPFRTFSLRSFF